MKQFITILIIAVIQLCAHAQSPAFFNYQGMAIDNAGAVLKNQAIDLRLTIYETSPNGNVAYQEAHQVITSNHGIFSLQIGKGNISQGQLSNVKWQNHVHWLETEIDYTGQGFMSIGLDQLVSVPYAMHAETVTNSDDADADPQNEIQSLSLNGNQLSISGGNSITIPTSGGSGDDDSTNEIQDLSSSQNGSDVTINISRNGQGTSFSINDDDADPQNEIQSLSLNNNALSISNGNTLDLTSISTPWKRDPIQNDIYYDQGTVRVDDSDNRIEITSYEILGESKTGDDAFIMDHNSLNFGNSQTSVNTQMNAEEFYVYDGASDQISTQTVAGFGVYAPECQAELQAGILAFQDTLGLANTFYSKDSLYYFGSAGNLAFPDVATLKPTHIQFETIGLGLKSTLGPGAQRNFDPNFTSELTSNQLRIWEKTQAVPFDRVVLNQDSLTIYNSAKWKNVQIEAGNKFGGAMHLFAPSGQSIVEIGANRDSLLGLQPPAGNIFLKDLSGKSRISAIVQDNYGHIFTESDSAFSVNAPGGFTAGPLTQQSGFQILDFMVDLRYDSKLDGGQLELFSGENVHKVAHLGVDPIDPSNGRLCLFNDNDDVEKVCAVASDFAGGEIYLFGNNSTKVYAGGYNDRGIVQVSDSLGFARAGMSVEAWDEGLIYVNAGGRIAIQDDQGFDRISLFEDNMYFLDSTGGTAISLGQDFAFSNVGYQYLYGRNGYANIFLGHDRNEGELGPSGNFGLIEAIDDLAITRSWMSGTGELGCGTFVLRDYNETNKIIGGTLPWNSSSWMDFYGGNEFLNVTIGSTTDGDFGSIQVYDNNGASQAGMYVDEITGQGHVFADVKNFRINHPNNDDEEIWYASLEGPEAAAYVRGTSTLIGGETFVAFPDHFSAVCNSKTMTIQLTPRHWDTYGLAVIEIKADGFIVKELKGGNGSFDFDWEAKGVRKGHENYKAVLTKAEVSAMLNPSRNSE